MTTVQQSKLQKVTDLAKFNEMYEGSYYTITGAGGDLNEWVKGYEDLLSEAKIGTPIEWYSFTGKQMNEHYGLSGSKAYPSDLNFLSFSLTNLEVGKLAIFKLQRGDRWFDDIVENNCRG